MRTLQRRCGPRSPTPPCCTPPIAWPLSHPPLEHHAHGVPLGARRQRQVGALVVHKARGGDSQLAGGRRRAVHLRDRLHRAAGGLAEQCSAGSGLAEPAGPATASLPSPPRPPTSSSGARSTRPCSLDWCRPRSSRHSAANSRASASMAANLAAPTRPSSASTPTPPTTAGRCACACACTSSSSGGEPSASRASMGTLRSSGALPSPAAWKCTRPVLLLTSNQTCMEGGGDGIMRAWSALANHRI